MVKNEIPLRSEYKYIEEEYELYELTHCMAYEMAIRNENVKHILKVLKELQNNYKEVLYTIFQNDSLEYVVHACLDSIYELLTIYNETATKKIDFSEIDSWDESTSQIGHKTINFIMKIIVELNDELNKQYYMIDKREGIIPKGLNDDVNPKLDNWFYEHIDESLTNSDYKNDYIEKAGYEIFLGADINNDELSCSKIKPKFKTSLKQFNQTEITLNLSLPKKELLAFVEKIKDDYDNEESYLLNYLEFLGKELGINSKVYKNMTAKKWADHFYIYDVLKLYDRPKIKEEIRLELTKYHGVRVVESEKTFKAGTKRNGKILEVDTVVPIYKTIPYEKYLEENPDMDLDMFNEAYYDEKSDKSIRSISNYNKLMKKLIEGENPGYKILLSK